MSDPDHLFQQCLELIRKNNLDEAQNVAIKGVENYPDHGDFLQIRGLIRHRLQDFERAGQDLETASLLVPLGASAQCALADCHVRQGKNELAVGLYRHLADKNDCPPGLLPAVASGFGALEDYPAALRVCRTLLARDAHRHEAHFGIAYYLRKLGHSSDEILPHVWRAHELSPSTPLYRLTLATFLDQAGRRDEAQDLLRGLDPHEISCPCCIRRIASIFHSAGKSDQSESV